MIMFMYSHLQGRLLLEKLMEEKSQWTTHLNIIKKVIYNLN